MFTDREILTILRMSAKASASGTDLDALASIRVKAKKYMGGLSKKTLEALARDEQIALQVDPLQSAYNELAAQVTEAANKKAEAEAKGVRVVDGKKPAAKKKTTRRRKKAAS